MGLYCTKATTVLASRRQAREAGLETHVSYVRSPALQRNKRMVIKGMSWANPRMSSHGNGSDLSRLSSIVSKPVMMNLPNLGHNPA